MKKIVFEKPTKERWISAIVTGVIVLSLVFNLDLLVKNHYLKEDIQRKQTDIDIRFMGYMDDIDINVNIKQMDDLEYIENITNLYGASKLVSLSSYSDYEGRYWYFSGALRYIGNYLRGFVGNEKELDKDIANRIQGIIEKIRANINDKDKCVEYISELYEVSLELP